MASAMAMILLTTIITFLSMIASWSIDKYVKGYLILFLLLETGVLGTFLALRFLPVLHLLGSDAVADVLPHRHLGWATA